MHNLGVLGPKGDGRAGEGEEPRRERQFIRGDRSLFKRGERLGRRFSPGFFSGKKVWSFQKGLGVERGRGEEVELEKNFMKCIRPLQHHFFSL